MAWPFGVVLDISPQSHNEVVNGPGVGVFLEAPHFVEHGLPRYHFAIMIDQIAKKIRLHQRQMKDLTSDMKFQKIKIDGLIRFIAERENMFQFARRHGVIGGCLQPLFSTAPLECCARFLH